MKTTIIAPAPLYPFLSCCNASPMEKEVLDCGAGGSSPPLAVFYEYGYRTHGIEISEKQLRLAQQFCTDHSMELGILQGDMRQLPFDDESMSFIYSYDSICHMTKKEVAVAMQEIERVLKKGGLCFVNFLLVDEGHFAKSKPQGPSEVFIDDGNERIIHSFYKDTEPDGYFRNFTLVRREKRRLELFREGRTNGWAEIDYIAQKR